MKDLEKYSFVELSKYFSNKGKADINGIGLTAESMREFLIEEFKESVDLTFYSFRQGFFDLHMIPSDKRITFRLQAAVTKASVLGSSVRFPKVQLGITIPHYTVVDIPKNGEKFKLTCNFELNHDDVYDLSKEDKKRPICEIIEELNTEGTSLNKKYKLRIKKAVVESVYHILFVCISKEKQLNYLSASQIEVAQNDFYNEEILDYMLENNIILEGFTL